MKKRIYLVLFILVSYPVFSQTPKPSDEPEDEPKEKKASYYQFPISPCYGTKFLKNSYFNDQLTSPGNYSFNKPLSYVGIVLVEHAYYGPWTHYAANIYYSQVLPSVITINDSVKSNLTGFQFGASILGFDLIRSNSLRLGISIGFNTGRLRFYGNENMRWKNAYFSPKISVNPSIRLGRIFLAAIVDYEYDVSNLNWKKMPGNKNPELQPSKLSQTGLTAQLTMGYMLKALSKKEQRIAKNKKNSKKYKKKGKKKNK